MEIFLLFNSYIYWRRRHVIFARLNNTPIVKDVGRYDFICRLQEEIIYLQKKGSFTFEWHMTRVKNNSYLRGIIS